MLDPLTALSVAGNVCQFIDFGLKATSKAREIHKSTNGVLTENIEIEALTEDIAAVTAKLEASTSTTGDDNLDDICERCTTAANELLEALKELKIEGNKNKWKSARKGLKAVWGKKRVEEMKITLEGWRDEIQFHVLVDLKRSIDSTCTKQSERFDTLDENGRAILEALSESDESIQETILEESIKLDERHEQITTTIMAKQEETQVEITQALESMDAGSRAEHEATRRELQQMKAALAQIEQDMKRRDTELKELLTELGKARSDKERRNLQERSNAVTVALCALVTVYQSLQRIIRALHAQAKIVLLSTNLSPLWGLNTYRSLPSIELELVVHCKMVEGLLNAPDVSAECEIEINFYLMDFNHNFWHCWAPLLHCQKRNFQWRAVETIEYMAIGSDKSPLVDPKVSRNPHQGDKLRKELFKLLRLLDSSPPENFEQSTFVSATTSLPTVTSVYPQSTLHEIDYGWRLVNCKLIECMVIISTVLTEYLGSVSAATKAMRTFGCTQQSWAQIAPFPRSVFETEIGANAGRIAGLQREAESTLQARYQKWAVNQPKSAALYPHKGIERFLEWLIRSTPPAFLFNIITKDPSEGARLYALIEFLIKVGFHLKLSIGMFMSGQDQDRKQSSKLEACVEKIRG